MSARIKTYIWASALVRRVQLAGAFAHIARKGDCDSGIALVKVCPLDGTAILYGPERSFDGEAGYRLMASGTEREIDEIIAKRANFDSDVWVIEIEDKSARHFLTETIFTP